MNPQSTYNPQGSSPVLQGSSPTIQGTSPQLQGGNITVGQLQPAAGIPLNTGSAPTTTTQTANNGQQYTVNSNGVNTTAGTYGYNMNQPEYLAGIQQEYNAAIQGGSQQIGQNQAYLPVQQADVNNYATAEQNAARSQVNNQVNTYNTQEQGVKNQQALSLAELADQIRGANQGFQAQLGAEGAGNSSASQMGQFALAKEQNINRANIQQQAGSNVANVEAEKQQVQNTLQPYLDTINQWKQGQIDSILKNYNTIQSQLEQAISQAQGEEKARLAMFGQTLQDAAGAALTQVDQAVQSSIAQYQANQGQAISGPQYQAPQLGAAPAPISSPAPSPFQADTTGNGNSTAGPAGGSLYSLLTQQANGALA